jgi:predicted transcriptional regulator
VQPQPGAFDFFASSTHNVSMLSLLPIRVVTNINAESISGAKMSEPDEKALVAQILSSYLSNNTVAAADLPSVIYTVKRAFGGSGEAASATPSDSVTKAWQPAVPVKKSITPEAVICLCCGERFKTLRRHLQTTHQLSPREYRATFGLKSDYPIVAPNYAAQRSDLAKSLGLGRKVGVKAAAKKAAAKRASKKSAAVA